MPSKAAKGMTKSQLYGEIASKVDLSKSKVSEVFDALSDVIKSELKAGKVVTVAGLVKIVLVRKAATAARQGINPFTKEKITIKAKPARRVVKVRALKHLKEMV